MVIVILYYFHFYCCCVLWLCTVVCMFLVHVFQYFICNYITYYWWCVLPRFIYTLLTAYNLPRRDEACKNIWLQNAVISVVINSVPGHSSGTVQAGAGRRHLGAEAHDAACRRHWTEHSLSAAAERCSSGKCRTELLPDLLHRRTAASVLSCHGQLTHCRCLELLLCLLTTAGISFISSQWVEKG